MFQERRLEGDGLHMDGVCMLLLCLYEWVCIYIYRYMSGNCVCHVKISLSTINVSQLFFFILKFVALFFFFKKNNTFLS